MKLNFFLVAIVFAFVFTSCKTTSKINKSPKKGLVLKFEQEDGANAAGVVFNPDKKYYYIAFAGNTMFPLETLDENGKNLNQTVTAFDLRGMWWNTQKNRLEANGYDNAGIVDLGIGEDGFPGADIIDITKNSYQPDEQSVGAYDYDNDEIIFYKDGTVYRTKNYELNSKLELKGISDKLSNINEMTMIYTGIAKSEYGVYNYKAKQVYLFDKSSGKLTETVQLPSSAPKSDRFRFSYANAQIWLYDDDARAWNGYKIK